MSFSRKLDKGNWKEGRIIEMVFVWNYKSVSGLSEIIFLCTKSGAAAYGNRIVHEVQIYYVV